MPAKGWRKPVKPIEGPLREEIEQWLHDGGYNALMDILKPEFGLNKYRAAALVHEAIASAMYPATWKGFDRTKRKEDPIGAQMKMVLWRKLIQFRRDHYDKPNVEDSLTDIEGMTNDIPHHSYKQAESHIDLQRAVESLEEPYREVFTLIARDGYTVKEVWARTDLGCEQIEDIYKKAKARLRVQLQAYGYNGARPKRDSMLVG